MKQKKRVIPPQRKMTRNKVKTDSIYSLCVINGLKIVLISKLFCFSKKGIDKPKKN